MKYEKMAAKMRALLGVQRLSPKQAADARAAVARHEARQRNRPLPPPQPGRYAAELQRKTEASVVARFRKLYRIAQSSWAGGETTIKVLLADADQHFIANGRSVRVWSRNGKWSGNNAEITITVDRHWLSTVASVPGLAEAGGMLTVQASQTATDCWEARWIEQARGFDIRCVKGYIVRIDDGTFAHGKTESAARQVARRRVER